MSGQWKIRFFKSSLVTSFSVIVFSPRFIFQNINAVDLSTYQIFGHRLKAVRNE